MIRLGHAPLSFSETYSKIKEEASPVYLDNPSSYCLQMVFAGNILKASTTKAFLPLLIISCPLFGSCVDLYVVHWWVLGRVFNKCDHITAV